MIWPKKKRLLAFHLNHSRAVSEKSEVLFPSSFNVVYPPMEDVGNKRYRSLQSFSNVPPSCTLRQGENVVDDQRLNMWCRSWWCFPNASICGCYLVLEVHVTPAVRPHVGLKRRFTSGNDLRPPLRSTSELNQTRFLFMPKYYTELALP